MINLSKNLNALYYFLTLLYRKSIPWLFEQLSVNRIFAGASDN